jgi:KDO2-lipid IV(A) lauroyltransferase
MSRDVIHDLRTADMRAGAPLPRRWTLHGLNNGLIFGATYHGVRTLPRRASYGIGHAGTWLAWRTMTETRRAVAANLAPLFPEEGAEMLERRSLRTLRSYANDTIDFLRALSSPARDTRQLFDMAPEYRALFNELSRRGRGIILVTGHYGNWEIGSLLIRRELDLPLTIVAMAEANPQVNRIRRQIRESLGADTLEVRQSFDTALQIRRRLADNHIVAMLIDRHYGRDRVEVTLFGRSAWFLRTPLLMAHATGAPVLPCFIERVGPGRFEPRPGEPIVVASQGSRDDAIRQAAQKVADALAERIRRHPEFWYHFYRYWDAQRDAYEGLA